MTDKQPLNLREYWDTVGTENVRSIISCIGSSMAYARLLRYGLKKPGSKFCLQFIETARDVTPGWEPDLELMLRGAPRATAGRVRTIPPSAKFLAAQAGSQS